MRDMRATFGWARLKPGWPEEGRRQSGLVTAAMFRDAGGRRGSVRWSRSFLEMMWSCWSDRRGVRAAGRPGQRGGRSGDEGRSTANVSGTVWCGVCTRVGSGSTGRKWRISAGGRGERGGADDGCPQRTGSAAAMARGGSFEEAEEGRMEEEDESKRARECAGENRRRRIGHGTAGSKRCRACRKETEEEAKWDASRDFSAITENIGTLL
jgi:hypothetical protein